VSVGSSSQFALLCTHRTTYLYAIFHTSHTRSNFTFSPENSSSTKSVKPRKDYVNVHGIGDDQLMMNLKCTIHDQLNLFHSSQSPSYWGCASYWILQHSFSCPSQWGKIRRHTRAFTELEYLVTRLLKFDIPFLLVSQVHAVRVSAVTKKQHKSVQGRLKMCFTCRQQVLLLCCEAVDTRGYITTDGRIVSG